jgi:pimeloyl-ACP methyl ester carboxylesterase
LPQAPEEIQLRDGLMALGYAVGWSSYSANGLAVKEGIQQTHQLRGLFTRYFGDPVRSYLIGESMGGTIALALAEKYPSQYDGSLPMCGFVGGTVAENEYYGHLGALFNYFFPGVLPEDPEGWDAFDLFWIAFGATSSDLATSAEMAQVDQLELPGANAFQLALAIAYGAPFTVIDPQLRHPWIDNAETTYTGSLDDAALNAGVARYDRSPATVNYLNHYYEPTGRLRIPVLTMHDTMDPINPFWHEEIYAKRVLAAGADDLLVQRSFEQWGHCVFTVEERVAAFLDLVDWVENGIKPIP